MGRSKFCRSKADPPDTSENEIEGWSALLHYYIYYSQIDNNNNNKQKREEKEKKQNLNKS